MGKRTPLYDKHVRLDAKIIDFGGFDMPVQYKGIKQEHHAVRNSAGLFDVSHMGEFIMEGPEALELIQYVTINDASTLKPGKAQYTAMCYKDGGIVDDLLVYMLAPETYMLVVNAANIEKDREWIESHNRFDAVLRDRSGHIALLALQGPSSHDILRPVSNLDPGRIPFYSFEIGHVADQQDVIVSATGYTGEQGFELYIDTEKADPGVIWDRLMEAGAEQGLEPAGLGARDTLRLEMGFALYGNDITKDTTPLEGRLGWLTKLDKGEFIGSQALKYQKEKGLEKKLVGFRIDGSRQIPRAGYDIFNVDDIKTGYVTSGTQSVTLGTGIGMGYVDIDEARDNNRIWIQIRKKKVAAVIQSPPFIKK